MKSSILCAASCWLLWWLPLTLLSAAANEPSTTDAEIAQLINDLGSASYFTRARATEQLQHLGLEAFDDLHDAQYHPDNEIAMAARFLVSSLMVSWSKESDPPGVHEALSEYGAQDEVERNSRIDMLAELPDRKGLVALARLARFETSLRLSRQAALAAIRQPLDGDPLSRQRNATEIQQTLGDSDRQSARWLRVYADDLASGEFSIERWRDLIADQRQQIDTAATDASNRQSVLELVRISAARAAQAGLRDEAIALATEHLDLIPPSTRDLIDACSWAIDQELHPFVIQLQQQHTRMFDQHADLLYATAEAYIATGDAARADQFAAQAARIQPLPSDDQERAKLQPRDIEDIAQSHRTTAGKLRDRGLFHWAEREYRSIIDSMEIDEFPAIAARGELAAMLAELQRHQDVVDVLEPLADRIDKDAALQSKLNNMMFSVPRVKSDLWYHMAMQLIETGDLDAARPLLDRAYQHWPVNIDILITMYRTNGDQEWNQNVQRMLNVATRQSELKVEQARLQARQFGRAADDRVANACNEYAWLVANTEGDYQKSLAYSLESLAVPSDPESMAARLDTCARCYFAVGDIDKAIMMQKRAIKLLPHSPPLQRQLAEFEGAQNIRDNPSGVKE
jgi:tetratricopeptide (TPR) repeat protein